MSKWVLGFFVLGVVTSLTAPAARAGGPARGGELEAAEQDLEHGRYRDVLGRLGRLFVTGDDARAHAVVGNAYFLSRQYRLAVQELELALRAGATNPSIRRAKDLAERLAAADPDMAEVEHAERELTSGRPASSLLWARRSLEAAPTARAHLAAGDACLALQRRADACLYFQAAARSAPDDPRIRQRLLGCPTPR